MGTTHVRFSLTSSSAAIWATTRRLISTKVLGWFRMSDSLSRHDALPKRVHHHLFFCEVQPHHLCSKIVEELLQRLSLILFYIKKVIGYWRGGLIRDVLCPEQLCELRERCYVAIREADEPVHGRSYQSAHEQLTPLRIGALNQHHLCMESRKVGLWSSTLVKVTLGPTSVAGITASMISSENGVGNSLGGVSGSWSAPSRSAAWDCRSLRSSSFERRRSSLIACDTTKSAWMRSWFALYTTTSSWRARIISITCCRALTPVWCSRSLPRTSHLLGFPGSCWWDSVLFRAPRWAPNVPAGWLETPSYAYVTLTSRVLALVCAFLVMNTWNTKTKGALAAVCTPTLKSVLGIGNTENCIILLLCVCLRRKRILSRQVC